jgi:hypothetical protein
MGKFKRSRAEQARINGAQSRGPITPEGRLRIAEANTKHGLYAVNATVMEVESNAAFDFYRAAAVRQLKPRTPFELQYVEEIADITWRIIRLRGASTVALNKQVDHIRRTAVGVLTAPAAITEAEISASHHNGAQTNLQRRVSGLIRDRQALLRELRWIQQAEMQGSPQMELATQPAPPVEPPPAVRETPPNPPQPQPEP